jgi:hypothetical protein
MKLPLTAYVRLRIASPVRRRAWSRTMILAWSRTLDANEIRQEAVTVWAWLGMQSNCDNYAWDGLQESSRVSPMAPI